MIQNFLVVLEQVSVLFLLMAVGFVMTKLGLLTQLGTGQMTALLLYVVTPCVIVDSFQTPCDARLLHILLLGGLATAGTYLIYILLAHFLFPRQEENLRPVLQAGSIYGNLGFMGLPLVRSVLGEGAAIFAVVDLGLFNIVTWTHGVLLMGGRSAFSAKKAILNPGVLGVLVGLPLFLLNLRLPTVLYSPVHFLAQMNTPLAMVIIGAQMGRSNLLGILRQRELYAAAAIKLAALPLLTGLLLLPIGMDPTFYTTVVILAGAPTAGITSMFAERFSRSPERAAQLVSLATLLSIVTLPIVGTLAQTIAF